MIYQIEQEQSSLLAASCKLLAGNRPLQLAEPRTLPARNYLVSYTLAGVSYAEPVPALDAHLAAMALLAIVPSARVSSVQLLGS